MVARAHRVAELRLSALPPLTLDFIVVVDRNTPVGTVVGVAVDFLPGVRQIAIGDGLRPPSMVTVAVQI